jgi:ribosomal protein S18 acetylase RimI-like enzyme
MLEPDRIRIVGATDDDLDAVAALAGVVWRKHYPGIITPEQIEYMLARGYARAALQRFLTEEGAGLELAHVDARFAGFAAYHPGDAADELKLDKLYVHPEWQSLGVGRRLIEATEAAAHAQRRATVILNVNKNNAQAIRAYMRHGFAVREAVVVDIGGGFVMDDYIMAKRLQR